MSRTAVVGPELRRLLGSELRMLLPDPLCLGDKARQLLDANVTEGIQPGLTAKFLGRNTTSPYRKPVDPDDLRPFEFRYYPVAKGSLHTDERPELLTKNVRFVARMKVLEQARFQGLTL